MRNVDRYCIHTIVLLRGPSGDDGLGLSKYGKPLAEATPTSLTLDARVEFDNHRVINSRGEEIICSAKVFIPPTYTDPATGGEVELAIGGQDRIVFEGRTYAVADRRRQEGWTSDRGRHWEVDIV